MESNVMVIKHSEPDNLGRVIITKTWYDPNPPYCSVCGKVDCGHKGTIEYGLRGQVFFTNSPEIIGDLK
jgi:hypothetical protein